MTKYRNIYYKVNSKYFYQEKWRDWPVETQQPAYLYVMVLNPAVFY